MQEGEGRDSSGGVEGEEEWRSPTHKFRLKSCTKGQSNSISTRRRLELTNHQLPLSLNKYIWIFIDYWLVCPVLCTVSSFLLRWPVSLHKSITVSVCHPDGPTRYHNLRVNNSNMILLLLTACHFH